MIPSIWSIGGMCPYMSQVWGCVSAEELPRRWIAGDRKEMRGSAISLGLLFSSGSGGVYALGTAMHARSAAVLTHVEERMGKEYGIGIQSGT